jgi:L-rhamnose mutarotase
MVVRRQAQVIRVRPERVDEYEAIHREVWPGVLATIERCNIRNYSIYRMGDLLFSYFEYAGEDYEADMAEMAADPVTQEWWKLTEPMQEPLDGRGDGEWWMTIPEVFHTD